MSASRLPDTAGTARPDEAASNQPDADDAGSGQAGPGQAGSGDELRTRLIRAAAEVFAREGYAGTKILDIVREAGVSTGAVYGRFRSKNELLREAVVRSSRRGGVMASGARSLGDLIRFGARLVGRPLYSFEAMRLEAYVAARRDPEVADALADAFARWREGVEPLVAAAKADGTLDDVDPEAVLFLYRTLYLGGLLHRGSGLAGPDPAAWEALVERLVAALGRPADAGAANDPEGPDTPDTGTANRPDGPDTPDTGTANRPDGPDTQDTGTANRPDGQDVPGTPDDAAANGPERPDGPGTPDAGDADAANDPDREAT